MSRVSQADGHSYNSDAAPTRVTATAVEALAERLSKRDWSIVEAVNRLRLVRGEQLERLCFGELSGHSREVVRGQVLRRLTRWQVLVPLPRRIGGPTRGSSQSAYALGAAGQRLLIHRQRAEVQASRVRRPGVPTDRTTRHTLAVSELYVSLTELGRQQAFRVDDFVTEPACWWPDGVGGWLKPDAYLVLGSGQIRDHTWVEVDLATESLPTLHRKLETYLSFVQHGQAGPSGLVPQVLVVAPGDHRANALHKLAGRLPSPADRLFAVTTLEQAPDHLVGWLRE